MIRRLLVGLCCLSALAAAGAAATWQGLLARIETPHPGLPSEGVFVDVRPGDSTRAIAERLEAAGVVREAWTFRFAAWRGRHERSLQAGEYYFEAPVSPAAALAKIVAGRVHLAAITFPEGLTLPQMGAIVEKWGLAPAAEFAAAARRVELVADLDPDATDLEGYLFPETYSLPRTATVDDLVAAMVARFRVVFRRGAALPGGGARLQRARRGDPGVDHPARVGEWRRVRAGLGRLQQPAPHRHAAAERSHDDLRPRARRPLRRQPDPRQPALRLALQHLRLPGPAARPHRRSGRRRSCAPRSRRRTSRISTS